MSLFCMNNCILSQEKLYYYDSMQTAMQVGGAEVCMGIESLALTGGVGVAGALGALARYLLGRLIAQRVQSFFPFGTLIINLTGAFLIGLFFAFVGHKVITSQILLLLATGFLGGYTTFSTMSWESYQLIRSGSGRVGLLYLVGSLALGLVAAAAGLMLGGGV